MEMIVYVATLDREPRAAGEIARLAWFSPHSGVAINSAPTEGLKRVPLSQVRSSFPVLKNPANRHKAVGFTFEQWRYAFTSTFSGEEARPLYERYHIPASGGVFWSSELANIHPGPDDTHVRRSSTAIAR